MTDERRNPDARNPRQLARGGRSSKLNDARMLESIVGGATLEEAAECLRRQSAHRPALRCAPRRGAAAGSLVAPRLCLGGAFYSGLSSGLPYVARACRGPPGRRGGWSCRAARCGLRAGRELRAAGAYGRASTFAHAHQPLEALDQRGGRSAPHGSSIRRGGLGVLGKLAQRTGGRWRVPTRTRSQGSVEERRASPPQLLGVARSPALAGAPTDAADSVLLPRASRRRRCSRASWRGTASSFGRRVRAGAGCIRRGCAVRRSSPGLTASLVVLVEPQRAPVSGGLWTTSLAVQSATPTRSRASPSDSQRGRRRLAQSPGAAPLARA